MPTISIEKETHEGLKKVGVYGEDMNDIVRRILLHWQETHNERKRRVRNGSKGQGHANTKLNKGGDGVMTSASSLPDRGAS